MSAHCAPLAPETSCDPYPRAYTTFVLAVMQARSHELHVVDSPAMRRDYVDSIEKLTKAYGDLLAARIEYASQHCHLSRRTADYAKAVMYDLAEDMSGELKKAFEGAA